MFPEMNPDKPQKINEAGGGFTSEIKKAVTDEQNKW